MNKLIISLFALSLPLCSLGQSFRAFKFDISIGYAIPLVSSSEINSGITLSLHPHYRFTDNFALGLRAEGAALGYQNVIQLYNGTFQYSSSKDYNVAILYSLGLSAEYSFGKGGFRPFIGLGGGYFRNSSLNLNNNTYTYALKQNNIGFFPELGFEWGHFRLMGDYNRVGNNNDYFSGKIGFFFGGRKKSRR